MCKTHINFPPFYLGIKGKVVKKICAMELLAVCLTHSYLIFNSFKHFSLINWIKSWSYKRSFSSDIESTVYIFESYCLILVSVLNRKFNTDIVFWSKLNSHLENDIGNPYLPAFNVFEDIKCRVFLKIVEICSSLIPFQENIKLELNNMILFIDINNCLKHCWYVYKGRSQIELLILNSA